MSPTAESNVALVVRHQTDAGIGTVLPLLERHGYDVRYVEASAIADHSESDASALVVVLGGDIAVYETEKYPYVVDELAFLTTRLEAERPTLGICLGAQLMSEALGGRASKGKSTVIGFRDIQLTDAGRDSPLRHFDGVKAMQWHGDSFRLPSGATRLASSAEYSNEAFRMGDFALAVQFHPELTIEMLDEWMSGADDSLAAEGLTADDLRSQWESFGAAMTEASTAMLDEWLASEVVASRLR